MTADQHISNIKAQLTPQTSRLQLADGSRNKRIAALAPYRNGGPYYTDHQWALKKEGSLSSTPHYRLGDRRSTQFEYQSTAYPTKSEIKNLSERPPVLMTSINGLFKFGR